MGAPEEKPKHSRIFIKPKIAIQIRIQRTQDTEIGMELGCKLKNAGLTKEAREFIASKNDITKIANVLPYIDGLYDGFRDKTDHKLQWEKREAQPEKIEDFGEVIEGAKKHIATRNNSTKEDITSMPLSKSFPKPDFNQLVESGQMTIDAAIVMNYLYENIPSKPRKHYRVAGWDK